VLEFTHIGDLTSQDVDRMRAVYQPLAESVRDLVDATIRTEVDADEVAAIKAEIDAATARLRAKQIDGAFGVRYTTGGDRMAWGNPVVGIRNPIAPPLEINRDESGGAYTDSSLVRPTRDRRATCTAGSRPWYSITCWARRPATGSCPGSRGPSRCGTCAPRDSAACTPKQESTARRA